VQFINELWVPILLATLACHIYSAVAWMVLKHHRSDWMRLPLEPELLETLRKFPPKPGQYSFPFFDGVNADRPDFAAAMKLGPIGNIRIGRTAPMNMGKMLVQTLFFFALCTFLTSYVAWHAFDKPLNAQPLDIARIVGTVSLMTYTLGAFPESVWFFRPWRVFFMNALDGVVHTALTVGIFIYFWPK
jgi:hypothetical protein